MKNKSVTFDWVAILVPAAIFVGAIVRFWGAGSRPIDGDEGLILSVASGSISHVLTAAANDVHPPLFHLLTSLSLVLFGVNALALRLVSIVAGIGVVSLAPTLAKRLGLNPIVATCVFALSPFLVYVSQDARMYSLFMFLVLASYLALMDVWEKPTVWQRWLVWGLAGLGMALTHHLGWVVLLAEGVATLALARGAITKSYHWLAAIGLIVVGYLPIVKTTVQQVVGRLAEQSTGAGLSERATSLLGAAYRTVAGRTFLSLSPHSIVDLARHNPSNFLWFALTIAVPLWLFVAGALWLYRTHRSTAWTWLVLAGIPVVVAAAVGSIAIQAPRYLSFLAPFVLMIISVGITSLWPRWWGKLLAGLFVVVCALGIWTQLVNHDRAPGSNAYAQAIVAEQKPGDVVLVRGSFGGGEAAALQLEAQTTDAGQSGAVLPPVVDMFSEYSVGNLEALRSVAPATTIDQLLSDHKRVWFFDSTYAPNPLLGLDSGDTVVSQQLGVDKERQPLTLYLITK